MKKPFSEEAEKIQKGKRKSKAIAEEMAKYVGEVNEADDYGPNEGLHLGKSKARKKALKDIVKGK